MGSLNPVKQYDFTLEEVQKLFAMQDTLNSYIHPEWKTQGFDWTTALVDEIMEAKGHLGWKWWKENYKVGITESNRKQVQLEVIDMLHFVVSYLSEMGWDDDYPYLVKLFNDLPEKGAVLEGQLQRFLREVPNEGINTFSFNTFIQICHLAGLTKSQILETYTQKYVLNKFRQDHGYKDGSYAKEWRFYNHEGDPDVRYLQGEDNYWLEQVVNKLRQGNHNTTDENMLYSELELLYNSRLNQ